VSEPAAAGTRDADSAATDGDDTRHGRRRARVRVTSSRRDAALPRTRMLASDLDEQTELGDVYLGGLMRAQLRLSVAVAVLTTLGIASVPVTYALLPAARSFSVLGVPVAWLVLGVAAYPATWLLARWYIRQAERVESDFADVVESR
jgi:hypothetical protein